MQNKRDKRILIEIVLKIIHARKLKTRYTIQKIHRTQNQRFYTFETRAQRIPRFIIPKNHAKTTCKIEIHHSNEKSRERNQLRRRINDFSLFFFLFSSLDTREIRISMDARGSEFSFAIEQFNKPQSVSDLANFPPPQEGHSPPSTVYIYMHRLGLTWKFIVVN